MVHWLQEGWHGRRVWQRNTLPGGSQEAKSKYTKQTHKLEEPQREINIPVTRTSQPASYTALSVTFKKPHPGMHEALRGHQDINHNTFLQIPEAP